MKIQNFDCYFLIIFLNNSGINLPTLQHRDRSGSVQSLSFCQPAGQKHTLRYPVTEKSAQICSSLSVVDHSKIQIPQVKISPRRCRAVISAIKVKQLLRKTEVEST